MNPKIEHGVNYQYVQAAYPESWDYHMQKIALHSDEYFFIHDIGQFISNAIYEGFCWDLLETVLDRNPIVILSAHAEGPSWFHIRRTVKHMINHYGIDPKRIILWSGSAAHGSEPCIVATNYHMFVVELEITLVDPLTIRSYTIQHHFYMHFQFVYMLLTQRRTPCTLLLRFHKYNNCQEY